MRIESIALAVTFLACTLLAAASSPTVTQVGQLFGTDVQETDFFGSATAMSQDGKTVAVGAPLGNGTAGEIYVYTRPSSGWGTMNQTARLHSTGQCILGQTLAMSADGGTIASSAGGCSGGGFLGYGWIEVFVRPASGWQDSTQPTAILSLNNNSSENELGINLAMSPDAKTIASTTYFGPFSHSSALVVFNRPAGGWASVYPSASVLLSDQAQGAEAVAISGSAIAVTNQTDWTVRVYQNSSHGIRQVATLSSSDGATLTYTLAADAKTIIAFALGPVNNAGRAYLFVKPSTGWASATETAQFSAPNLSSSAWFGSTISISGKSLLIGGSSTSAAYLFQQPTGGWQSTSTPDATILSTDPNQQSFGNAVAIAGSTLVIGDSHAGADSSLSGAAYVYQLQ